MKKFLVIFHKPEISVTSVPEQSQVLISVDDCPPSTDKDPRRYTEITIFAGEIPHLIRAPTTNYLSQS